MRNWAVGINDYYYTSSIYLEEAPWHIFALQNFIQYICFYIPRIPLPKIKIIRENEETNLKEYYGTLSDIFHVFICVPVFNWCYKRIKSNSFNFPYFMLKEEIPDSFKSEIGDHYWEHDEEEVIERSKNIKYSKMIGDEFNIVYNKLKNISADRMKVENL